MEKKQLFKVLDALKPERAHLKEYLDKVTKKALLPVVFEVNGKYKIRHQIPSKGHFIGIIIDDILIFNEMFRDYEGFFEPVTVKDIREFGRTLDVEAKPFNDAVHELLLNNLKDFEETLKRVRLCGYKTSTLPDMLATIEDGIPDNETQARGFPLCRDISSSELDLGFFQFMFYCNIEQKKDIVVEKI